MARDPAIARRARFRWAFPAILAASFLGCLGLPGPEAERARRVGALLAGAREALAKADGRPAAPGWDDALAASLGGHSGAALLAGPHIGALRVVAAVGRPLDEGAWRDLLERARPEWGGSKDGAPKPGPPVVALELFGHSSRLPGSAEILEPSVEEAGLYGLRVEGPEGAGYVASLEVLVEYLAVDPSDPLPRPDRYEEAARRRAGLGRPSRSPDPDPGRRAGAARVRAEAWALAPLSTNALRLERGLRKDPGADGPREAARLAARHLAQAVGEDGLFRYRYDPLHDRELEGYNNLRHAGTVYSLWQYAAFAKDRESARAARRATDAMKKDLRFAAPDLAYLRKGDAAPLGGAALALLAFLEMRRCRDVPEAQDPSAPEIEERLARFLLFLSLPDGTFYNNLAEAQAGGPPGEPSAYYPGEAFLAMVRRARGLGNETLLPRLRAIARRQHARLETEGFDHWRAQALGELFLWTGEEEFGRACLDEVHAAIGEQHRPQTSPRPDWIGGFAVYDPPGAGPAGVRLEALGVALRVARALGVDPGPYYGEAAGRASDFLQRLQVSEEEAALFRDPARAAGGLRANLLDWRMRIDQTQHALSGWLNALEAESEVK